MGSVYDFLFGKDEEEKEDKKKEELTPSSQNDLDFIKGMRGMGNGHKKKSNKKAKKK